MGEAKRKKDMGIYFGQVGYVAPKKPTYDQATIEVRQPAEAIVVNEQGQTSKGSAALLSLMLMAGISSRIAR